MYYDGLVENFFNNKQEAKEVADFIVKTENVKDIEKYDFVEAYERYGARWDDEELIADINDDGSKFTIEKVLSDDKNFIRLSTGIILSWQY